MQEFNVAVDEIILLDKNDQLIKSFSETLREKDVKIKIKRETKKIKRNWSFQVKEIQSKLSVEAEFSILSDFSTYLEIEGNKNEFRELDGMKAIFRNKENGENFDLFNCNLEVEYEINYKYEEFSFIKFKLSAQGGQDDIVFELVKGRTHKEIQTAKKTHLSLSANTHYEIRYNKVLK